MKTIEDLPERIASKITPEPMSGCWLWTHADNGVGYGVCWFEGKQVLTHRVVHQLFIGPIPVGYQVDHLCGNPSCVSPWHLEAVTPKVNTQRSRYSRRTHCNAGHQRWGLRADGWRYCLECARLYQLQKRRDRAAA